MPPDLDTLRPFYKSAPPALNTHIHNCSSGPSGAASNGSSSHSNRSRCVSRFKRRKATRFAHAAHPQQQQYGDKCCICVFASLVPTKVLIFRFCLSVLKKVSICQRRYGRSLSHRRPDGSSTGSGHRSVDLPTRPGAALSKNLRRIAVELNLIVPDDVALSRYDIALAHVPAHSFLQTCDEEHAAVEQCAEERKIDVCPVKDQDATLREGVRSSRSGRGRRGNRLSFHP
jgi:hypothetical protein